ncbi:MAG: LysM peptidoglycan-binding domain-containing protein, partial [Kiritimatiellia bacterium]
MKTNISLFGSVSALLVASVFLQGCRTYQPGVSTRRTLFSTPEQSYTPSAQPAPAAVHTTPATVKPASETAKSVAGPKAASFAPVSVATKQPAAAPSVHTVAPTAAPAIHAVTPMVPASTRLPPKTDERPMPTVPVVASATTSQPAHALNYRIHTVQAGEFAGKIANDNGMTLKEFTELNKISDPNHLRVGQTVKIAVGRKALAAGPAAPAVSIPGKVHVVAPGESLSVISARTGVSEKELVAINGIKDPNRIRVGQKLRLTRGEAAATVAPIAAPKAAAPAVAPATAPKATAPVAAPATAPKATAPAAAPVELPISAEAKKDD